MLQRQNGKNHYTQSPKWMVAVAIFLFWKKVGLFFVKYPRFFVVRQKSNFVDFGCASQSESFVDQLLIFPLAPTNNKDEFVTKL
jgi:hypothetical protein